MNDLECPRCGNSLRERNCTGCGTQYREVFGVPFIGDYEPGDILGLVEIAAHSEMRSATPLQADSIERLDALCAEYDAAEDKAAFIAAHPDAGAWDFPNHYSEWLTFRGLLDGFDLKGLRVLDIGAGLGSDAQRLALRGANVTALEFNPILAELGQKGLPNIRWIGGFSHVLPFKTASFDAVFVNAALHHMRDIPAAISEALRVLRVGGVLITTEDPFRPDDKPISFEFEVFDKHKYALGGINEQIPRFGDFVETFQKNAGLVSVDLFTHEVFNHETGIATVARTQWDLERGAEILRRCNGAIAMRAKLLKPWPHARQRQSAGILPPTVFAEWLTDQSAAIARLAAIIPAEHVDLPFPGGQTKFSLLNGWRMPAADTPGIRTAYRRARWFLTRQGARELTFSIRSLEPAAFTILINNGSALRLKVGADWQRVTLPLSGLDPVAPFVIEIRRDEDDDDFDRACFDVQGQQREYGWFARMRARFGRPRIQPTTAI